MTFLCRHKSGVWYYRKTYLLESGKRKEVRRSLRTSDFKVAQFLALKLFFDTPKDRQVIGVISDHKTGEQIAVITQPKPLNLQLSTAILQFLAEKSRTGQWCDKEYRRGQVMLEALQAHLSMHVMCVYVSFHPTSMQDRIDRVSDKYKVEVCVVKVK